MRSDLRRNVLILAAMLIAVLAAIAYLAPDGPDGPSRVADDATDAERVAALRARLEDLRFAQDTFHRRYGVYGRSVDQMRFAVDPGMQIEIIAHSATGWAAQASAYGVDRWCAIFVGDSARWAFPPAHQSGVPACTP